MTGDDLIIIGFCGLIGFGLVWFVLSLRNHPNIERTSSAEKMKSAPKQDQALDWCQVVEVPQPATMDEVRVAYRRKTMQYHPNRVEALGPEFKLIAETRTRENTLQPIINRADNAFVETLAKLMASHGSALIKDQARCRGFLSDHHPQQRREIELLVNAHAEGIPEILAASASELWLVVPRLIRHLEEQLFLTHEAATWAVETWTLALHPTWAPK